MFSHREYFEINRYILAGEKCRQARLLCRASRLRQQGLRDLRVPSERIILNVIQRLLDHGQFTTPAHALGSGRARLALDVEDEILDFFEWNPRAVREHLTRRYGDRWIGRGGPVAWPARSPDLTHGLFLVG